MFAGAVVKAGAQIGPGVIINTVCSIDHGCFIGEVVHINPDARLAGGCGSERSWVGICASNVAVDVIVGAGVAVLDEFSEKCCCRDAGSSVESK